MSQCNCNQCFKVRIVNAGGGLQGSMLLAEPHEKRFVTVQLSRGMSAEYDRDTSSVMLYWRDKQLILTTEETYHMLAFLHAEMPASTQL